MTVSFMEAGKGYDIFDALALCELKFLSQPIRVWLRRDTYS